MNQRSELGKSGEELTCRHLEEKGYKIIERNFRRPWGELDIVARAPDKSLVFVEVKTMTDESLLRPEDQLTAAKLKKFKRAASLYAGHKPDSIDDGKGWRLDLVAVVRAKPPVFRHYENVA